MYTHNHSNSNHSSRPHHHRARSSSDPFLDPVLNAHSNDPPPPPPKPSKKQTRHYSDIRDPNSMLENAVRESVTVRGGSDPSPRNRMGRSQTGGVPHSASGSKHAAPPTRRSYSQDSATQVMEKSRSKSGGTKVAKKGSSHADVIDMLDFTSNAIFHHDSPFDACAPSRNRHKSKAPMAAWSKPEEEAPASAAQLRADRRLAAVDRFGGGFNDSPYPNIAYNAVDDYHQPKNAKQVDRIAEAWGIHEPEPYEEFFGGGGGGINGDASAASSIRGGYESHLQSQTQNTNGRSRGYELRETYSSDAPPMRKPTGRLPPPQPLNLPGSSRTASLDVPGGLPSPPLSGSPGAPKRSKSLMQKFRKMRDQPNVPVVDAVIQGRPTHRQQNSFFGRFGGRNTSAGPISPTESSEHYVYVEKSSQNKALPPPPRPVEIPTSPYGNEKDGYFEGPGSPGTGLGRKTSLLKRVKGVVRGGATK